MESRCSTSVKLALTVFLRSLARERYLPGPKGSCIIPAVQQDCNGRLSEVNPLNPHQKAFRCNENLSFDGVTSGYPGEVSKNIIRKECGSSKSRATRVGVETIGIGLLSECGTFETHFENRGRIMPSRNNISNALSPQLKDREQGKDLRTRLEEGLTSSNIEMEGLINFLINELLNIKDKERDTYVDGVVNVFTEFLREPNDHQPSPIPKKRTKEEEKKSRRFEAGTHSSNRSSSETPNVLRPTLSRTSPFVI
ncbi:hypothetical protein T08_15355 [Trichinella sp. T8]|nr:hypothetical protein T08_15355 [Trichinella sp. T8]